MLTARRSLLLRNPLVWGTALGLLTVVMVAFLLSSSFGGSDDDEDDHVFNAVLPPRPSEPAAPVRTVYSPEPDGATVVGKLANPAFTEPTFDPLKPNEPDLQLVDASPFGPLPRIAEDGRQSVQAYARPYDRDDQRPKIAIIVTGLGQQVDATNATFHLPGAISLMFSPYSEDLPAFFERARLAGHEVLLELPMEPPDYPASDPGPHTLRASGTVDANIERLNWVLARAPGYVGVAGKGGSFGSSPEAAPIMRELAAKGVGMIELAGDELADASTTADLGYLSVPLSIDDNPSPRAISEALEQLEAKARADGYAVGFAEAYPVTLQRLVEWATTLDPRGLALVPASAILLETTDALAGDDQGSSLAQSRN